MLQRYLVIEVYKCVNDIKSWISKSTVCWKEYSCLFRDNSILPRLIVKSTQYALKSLQIYGAKIWNALRKFFKSAVSLQEFKSLPKLGKTHTAMCRMWYVYLTLNIFCCNPWNLHIKTNFCCRKYSQLFLPCLVLSCMELNYFNMLRVSSSFYSLNVNATLFNQLCILHLIGIYVPFAFIYMYWLHAPFYHFKANICLSLTNYARYALKGLYVK